MNLRESPNLVAGEIANAYGFEAAHTVVIKGVHMFMNSASVEYSDLDMMQMMGRAVRSIALVPALESNCLLLP